jgi:hypothetical protein
VEIADSQVALAQHAAQPRDEDCLHHAANFSTCMCILDNVGAPLLEIPWRSEQVG